MDGDIVDGEEEGSWRLTGDTLETIYEGEQTDLHVLELTETAFRYEIVNEYGSYTERASIRSSASKAGNLQES